MVFDVLLFFLQSISFLQLSLCVVHAVNVPRANNAAAAAEMKRFVDSFFMTFLTYKIHNRLIIRWDVAVVLLGFYDNDFILKFNGD